MTMPDNPWQLDAFVDGELDLAGQLAMEARLRDDAELRSQLQALRKLRDTVRGRATYHAAPPDLRARVQALVAPRAPGPRRRSLPAWPWWAGAASLAASVVLALQLLLAPSLQERQVEQDVVASHVRATLGQRALDVASSDHHTVKPWLSSRLDFSPEVRELEGGNAALLGARVDYIGGRPVAALVYRAGQHVADDFTWPTTGADRAPTLSSTRGFNVAHWTRGGMEHWLISDLNREELRELARRLGKP
ncbi:anti-sigma factor family protein [Ramlibacter sp. MMS24-I3-19]|uniref:anti-sigma factor family protein n=1 Tax=Ramlibacter sp. MMS24-I3-19 TaxID=3416606 RepID=UPI003CFFE1B0